MRNRFRKYPLWFQIVFTIALSLPLLLIVSCALFGLYFTFNPVSEGGESPSYNPRTPFTTLFIASNNFSSGDIYGINRNGEPTALITEAFARFPVWSRTNQELMFVSGQPNGNDIFVFDVEQQTLINLTQNVALETYPRWSPDGQKIAFATDLTGDWEVFVINRDGTNLVNLSNSPDASDGTGGLDWSHDGEQIVFTSDRNERMGIYIMNADGSSQQLLLPNDPPSADTSPTWSHRYPYDIAFISHRAEGYGIYTINVDGSELTFVEPVLDFPSTARYGHLAWSPNGYYLAYEISIDGVNTTELYLFDMNLFNRIDQIQVTDNDLYDAFPAWMDSDILESELFPLSLSDIIENSS